jgi:hypothetical protein
MIPQNNNTEFVGYAAAQAFESEFCLPSHIPMKKDSPEA